MLWAIAPAAPAHAQGALSNGENHTGAISAAGEVDTWTFGAALGERLMVSVAEAGADTAYVPYIRVFGPAGEFVAHSWGYRAGNIDVAAPATGTYSVLVSSNDAGTDATGSYILRLAKVPGAFAVPAGDQGGPLTTGGNHAGVIERADLDIWTVSATAGERLIVTAGEVGTDTAYVPYIRVFGPAGEFVAHRRGYRAASVEVAAAASGTYTVVVASNDAAREMSGSYVLRLAKVPGAFVVPTGDEGGALINGGNHAGVIDRADLDIWTVSATAGERLIVTAGEVGTDTAFVPYLRLFGPAGEFVAHSWGYRAASVEVAAAASGTYTVVVASNDAAREMSGSYVLRLAKVPGAFVVPTGDEGGALGNNRTVSGRIDRADLDQWTFTAPADRVVTLTITEVGTNGDFVPYLRLFGPTGSFVAHAWNSTNATLTVTIPVTGQYRIVAASNDAARDAEGSYTLVATGIDEGGLPANPRGDTAIDFGEAGLWMRYNHGDAGTERWARIDARNPSRMATGDIDGNGRIDLIATFPGGGTQAWMNDTEWVQLHHLEAVDMTTGDLDADGRDDVVFSFTGYGTFVWFNNTSWTQLHGMPAAGMTTGNLDDDADGRDDLVINFAGYGLWRYMNNSTWSQLHPLNATDLRTASLDGNERADLVMNFAGYGVWIYANNDSWSQLHRLNAAAITVGDIDGDVDRRHDVVLTFTGYGVWSWMNNATWVARHSLDSRVMASGDIDGSGRDDLLLSFNSYGIWLWMNNVSWSQMHSVNPDAILTGRFDDH